MKRLGRISAAATALVAAAAFLLSGSGRPTVALGAADATPPEGAVGGLRSPASGTLELRITASDAGSGLAAAEATLDGAPPVYVRLGSDSCPEHPAPGSDPPPGAACPESVAQMPLVLDTRAVADGERRLRVTVTDGAGNTATLVDQEIVVRNASNPSGTIATVTVAVRSEGEGEGSQGEGKGSESGGRGSSLALRTRTCRSPRLRMRLARPRPQWRTRPKRVPVLRFGGHYIYTGRLTCRVSGHRVSAPRGTPVNVFYRVWELTFKRRRGPVRKLRKRPIRVRKGGRLRVRLGGFRSGRTLFFRYRHGEDRARAKVRVAVAPRGRLLPRWLR
jgi:hypothetical protein